MPIWLFVYTVGWQYICRKYPANADLAGPFANGNSFDFITEIEVYKITPAHSGWRFEF
jgi:hypothetical protein